MVQVPHLEAWITVVCDGKELDEYAHVVDGKKVTCYVPSTEGKVFEIHFKGGELETGIRFSMYLDGASRAAFKRNMRPGQKPFVSSGVQISETTLKQYCFGSVTLRDSSGGDMGCDEDTLSALGSIHFTVEHVKFVQGKIWSRRQTGTNKMTHTGSVCEKSKSSANHFVTFGAELSTKRRRSYGGNTFVSLEAEKHEVTFRYASDERLRADGIIPNVIHGHSNGSPQRRVSKKRVKKEQLVDTDGSDSYLSDPEEAALYARLRAKKKARHARQIKDELTEIPLNVFYHHDLEIIDLTGED